MLDACHKHAHLDPHPKMSTHHSLGRGLAVRQSGPLALLGLMPQRTSKGSLRMLPLPSNMAGNIKFCGRLVLIRSGLVANNAKKSLRTRSTLGEVSAASMPRSLLY